MSHKSLPFFYSFISFLAALTSILSLRCFILAKNIRTNETNNRIIMMNV